MSKVSKSEKAIDSLKEKFKKDAEELVLKKFPKKILELDSLLNAEKFNPNLSLTKAVINIPIPDSGCAANDNTSAEQLPQSAKRQKRSSAQEENEMEEDELLVTKAFLFPKGVVECNKQLIELIDILKPRMLELIEDAILLKLAIHLMIPKIEDGNNFGVEIQTETIEAISGVEEDVQKSFDTFSNYFQTRGDLIRKVAKYPHTEDFRRAVQEYDEKFHLNLCFTLTDIRNHYANLHDLVTKNLNKIKQPRSATNKQFLY